MSARARVGLAACFGLGLGLGACRLPNRDHCFNAAIDGDAWCAEEDPERPWCSPCAYDDAHHGCVAEQPNAEECPLYTSPAVTSGTETGMGTETETGAETGMDTDTGTGR